MTAISNGGRAGQRERMDEWTGVHVGVHVGVHTVGGRKSLVGDGGDISIAVVIVQ